LSAVEVRGLSKRYGALAVLDAVDARFESGRFTSLLGPSGSGKTTLLRVIGGFVQPEAGRVLIGDDDVTAVPLWRRNIGMVFQSYALFPHMTVAENIAYGLHRRGIRGAAAKTEVARAVDIVRLGGLEARRPKQLSGGQQQRVALARAMVTKPRVLLLDEPLSALDRRLRQEMQVELRRIQRDSGLTTIFVTHDQEEALTLSDRVAILDGGRIVEAGEPVLLYERPRTRFAAAFLGDANFFSGRVVAGGVAVGGNVIRTADALPPLGQPATLAVRPEKITLLPDTSLLSETAPAPEHAAGDVNSIDATLRQIVYAGATSTFFLAGPDGAELKVFASNREAPTIALGARVALTWSPAHSVLIAD
jgi:spermidine/putrescine transport system ATP-binding protein